MKKNIIILIMIITFSFYGCSSDDTSSNNSNTGNETTDNSGEATEFYNQYDDIDENTAIVEIDAVEFNEKLETGDSFVVMVGAYTWPHCQAIIGEYDSYAQDGYDLYYISALDENNSDFLYVYNIDSVPTFLAFKDGTITDTSKDSKYQEYSTLEELLSEFINNNLG